MVEAIKIGKNESLEYFVDDTGMLTIKIDTTKDIVHSASGKTTLIASSSCNAKINIGNEINGDREAFLGLNLYYK